MASRLRPVPHRHPEFVKERTLLSNPFDPGPSADPVERLGALAKYSVWIAGRRDLLSVIASLRGRRLTCQCSVDDPACHLRVLLDLANPPKSPYVNGGRAMALTLRRPWASLLLTPHTVGGKNVENRTWGTHYRGPVLIYGGTRVDDAATPHMDQLGLDSQWHTQQQGWLGAAILTDVHVAANGCCMPWGEPQRRKDRPIYHWVFSHPHRLAAPTWGRGFVGLQHRSWSVLVRPSALRPSGDLSTMTRSVHGRKSPS
ncbi:DUF4326 domain-containing protein [Mycolicibacterium goodii]|uniref:DUF4326 domain-containing protein n=1 Tax=Mycolicibacterium goodii TaxID=134601 RepID=UPI001BDCDE37|nr:DUF4326 domain-containing protein [Mycolicibacterium goodii]MBU8819251.1 DUF4326 domain-containing protein [Mycolicibacterium goodii]